MLEVVECGLRLFGPREVACLLEQPIKRECFFAELADEAAKHCESACQLLDVSKRLWRSHVDGLYLLWVAFDPSFRDEVAQQLARGYPKGAFLWVKLDAISVEVGEGFSKVIEQAICLRGLDDNVVDIDLDIVANLFLQARLHAPLICGSGVL
jgi:hypothetical protein